MCLGRRRGRSSASRRSPKPTSGTRSRRSGDHNASPAGRARPCIPPREPLAVLGPAYSRYLRTVADNPDFVGAHWFQYIDEPLTGRTLDGENAHVGFVTVADLPYAGLVAAAREANLSVLRELQRIAVRATQ